MNLNKVSWKIQFDDGEMLYVSPLTITGSNSCLTNVKDVIDHYCCEDYASVKKTGRDEYVGLDKEGNLLFNVKRVSPNEILKHVLYAKKINSIRRKAIAAVLRCEPAIKSIEEAVDALHPRSPLFDVVFLLRHDGELLNDEMAKRERCGSR